MLSTQLTFGKTKSCGCHRVDVGRARGASSTKHGHAARRSPEYRAWESMRARCGDPNHVQWANYGGRGIAVCPRWESSFEAFLEDMGPRPEGQLGKRPAYSLDRIDNSGNYEPGNCRWATWGVQNNNRRPGNERLVNLGGETKPLRTWLSELGMKAGTFHFRQRLGMSEEAALLTPLRPRRS